MEYVNALSIYFGMETNAYSVSYIFLFAHKRCMSILIFKSPFYHKVKYTCNAKYVSPNQVDI